LCYFAEDVKTRGYEEEKEIKEAVVQPWLMKHFLETARNVSCITQLEMDRFLNTTGLLQDYVALSLREDRQPKHWRFEPPEEIGDEMEKEWTLNLASLLLAEELPDQYLPDSFVAYCQSMLKAATAYVNELVITICTETEIMEHKFKLKAQSPYIVNQKGLAAQQMQLLKASYFFYKF
jgi:hypothetical protein